jgi:hypothetical protein
LEENQSQPNQPSAPSDDAGNLTIEKAIAQLQSDDRGLRMYAAWWLGRFRVNQPEVIEVLIESLSQRRRRSHQRGRLSIAAECSQGTGETQQSGGSGSFDREFTL